MVSTWLQQWSLEVAGRCTALAQKAPANQPEDPVPLQGILDNSATFPYDWALLFRKELSRLSKTGDMPAT
eukprot:354460-Chlamydomonas_euryale.AAC.11